VTGGLCSAVLPLLLFCVVPPGESFGSWQAVTTPSIMPVPCGPAVFISQVSEIEVDGYGLEHSVIGTAYLKKPRSPAISQADLESISGRTA
jgi:hypothetical protein